MNNLLFNIANIGGFKENFVTVNLEPKIIDKANLLIKGQLTTGYDSIQSPPYDPDNLDSFDWSFQQESVTNTFLLYILGLRHVYILARAFFKTNELTYMDLAWKFIVSFHSFLFSKKQKNSFITNDHTIAERIENLVYFGYVAKIMDFSIKFPYIIDDLITNSNDRLLSDDYYQFNHNHGIIVDKALIIGAYCMNNKRSAEMINHAVSRIKQQIQFAFSPEGIHVENSFDYHLTITQLLRSVNNCLYFINNAYYKELSEILEKTSEYLIYAFKPNLQRPLFGDSKGVKGQNRGLIETNSHPCLEYINSMGQIGTRPKHLLSHFSNSGYVFIREHFNPESFSQSTWISLKAGFVTRTHKHQDDLSICLYSKGYDIFVDAGMYNFIPKNPYKEYMESIPAHTTIGIIDTPYSIAKGNGEKFAIQTAKQYDNFDYVLACSHGYENCAIYRHLYFFRKENIIIIRDEVFSNKPQFFAQYFHLGTMISIKEISTSRSILKINNSEYSVVMKQLSEVDSIKILNGIETEPKSILSTGFSEFVNTQTLQYNKYSNHFEYITSIEIMLDGDAKNVELNQVTFDKTNLLVKSHTIPLSPSIPIIFQGVEIVCDNLTIKVKNKFQERVDCLYALYIYDDDLKKIVEKIPYINNQEIDYTFSKPGNYVLLYYIKRRKEIIKGIVATLCEKHQKININQQYNTLHTPKIGSIIVKRNDDNEYKFEIPIIYDFSYQVKWWVYCDGINLACIAKNNENKFQYQFEKPGDYVIMYSVSDLYFSEIHFSQSELIRITEN